MTGRDLTTDSRLVLKSDQIAHLRRTSRRSRRCRGAVRTLLQTKRAAHRSEPDGRGGGTRQIRRQAGMQGE
eukprot:1754672-Pleurochrysis_carterae.AAC.2